MTEADFKIVCTCFMAGLVVLAIYAWVELYRLWRSRLRYIALSSIYQIINLLGWVLVLAALSFCSILIVWLLSAWISLIF
jgi:hypothetical protein